MNFLTSLSSEDTLCPMIWASPVVGVYSPQSILKVVVLPAPLTPSKPKPFKLNIKVKCDELVHCPFLTPKEILSTATL